MSNSSVVAVQGPDNSLDFYWQTIGTAPWNPESVAGNGTAFSAPSVAQVGNSSVIAVQGPDNSLDFYWQTIGTGTWHAETVAGNGTAFSAPSVAQVGNSSVIAVQGPDNSLDFYWQTIGTGTWHAETVAGNGTTFSAPSVAQVGNSSVIAAQGPNDDLVFYWQKIGTATWHAETVAGNGTTFSAPSVAQVEDSSVIAAQGPNDDLVFYWQRIDAAAWHAETVAGNGTAFSAPSVAQVGNSSVIAVQGPDNSLDFYWQTIGTGTWHAETVAGNGTTFSAPSVAQVEDSSVIAAQGPNDDLVFYWQTIGTATWHAESVAGKGTAFSASSAAPQLLPVPAPSGGLKGNSNYLMYSNCNDLLAVSVSIVVTQEITGSNGFSLQLNAYSAQSDLNAAQQYVLVVDPTDAPQLKCGIDFFTASNHQIAIFSEELISLASLSIPAGYTITVSLLNDSAGRVTAATYTVTNANGTTLGQKTITLASLGGMSTSDLAPIVAFQLDLVGPNNGEETTLSSGAGQIFYQAATPLTALSAVPSCVDWDYFTVENSNSTYATLPSGASTVYSQSFGFSADGVQPRAVGTVNHVTLTPSA